MAERVFLRGLTSAQYGLAEQRRRQHEAPRVKREGFRIGHGHASVGYEGLGESSAEWLVGPGDDPFYTQSLQVHTVDLAPGGRNDGHGHQNEALFYVFEGTGYDIHDGERYDWEAGDALVVHADSVHQHFNASAAAPVHGIIFKAKALWLYLGLWQQGKSGPVEDAERYGPRVDWSRLWTPGVAKRRKVVKRSSTRWEDTPDGRVRVIASGATPDVRVASVDLVEQEIAPGERSAKHWHMADEVLYIESGRGESWQWDVTAEIADRYYAHVAKEPGCWEFAQGNVVYIPQNTVHQHANTGSEPLRFLSGQNRLFKLLGYDAVVHPEE
jgi:quercetin dioxygenase-like cupin family protein